jgi:predicted permease
LIAGGFGLSVLGWLLGRLALGLSRNKLENKGTFLFLCAVGNSSFLPLPLAEALWGQNGIQGCLFYILGNNLFLFSAGIGLLAGSQKREKWLILKGILHPQALATGLALLSVAAGLAWPAWSLDAVTLLGKSTIPLAMLVAGGLLAGVDFKSIENIDLLGLSLGVKLLALPLVVGLALKTLQIKGIFADILFLEACMPCLASSGVYALRFGGDVKLASEGSFWSHLLALLTIPLFFWFLAPAP